MNTIRWYQVSMLLLFALVSGQGFAQPEPSPSDALDTIKIEKLSGESLFLRKLLWASLPNKRQKLRDR